MNSTRSGSPRGVTARIAGLLCNLLVAVVLLVSVAFLLPSLFGFERYVITGGSMSGTFEKGSIAFEETVPVSELEVGDVVTYVPPADSGVSNLVTHRIVTMKPAGHGATMFRTKGDANAAPDPWKFELSSETQPRVEFTVPMLGYVFIALADRDTRVLVIGVPAGLIALYSLVELARALRPRRSSPEPASVPAPSRRASSHLVGA